MVDSEEAIRSSATNIRARRSLRLIYWMTGLAAFGFFACAGFCLLSPLLLGFQQFEGDAGTNRVANEIVKWTLPPAFIGEVAISVDNSFLRFDIAKFAHKKGRGTLILAKSQWRAVKAPAEKDVRRKLFEAYWIGLVKPEIRNLDFQKHESTKSTLCGLPGEFEAGFGEDRGSTTKYRQVTGYFQDESTDAYFLLQVEDPFMTDEEINTFLNSIAQPTNEIPHE